MTTIIELQRGSRPYVQPLEFSCDLSTWRLLLEVGKAFGWRPRGAPYVESVPASRGGAKRVLLRHDYEPGSSDDAKKLDAHDSASWAEALSVARASPHLCGMICAYKTANVVDASFVGFPESRELFLNNLDSFISYLHGGEFHFSIRESTD